MENKDLLLRKKWFCADEHLLQEVNCRSVFANDRAWDRNSGIVQNNYTLECERKLERNTKPLRSSLESFHVSKKRRSSHHQVIPISQRIPENIWRPEIQTESSAFTIRFIGDSSLTSISSDFSKKLSNEKDLEHSSPKKLSAECNQPKNSYKSCYFCNTVQNWPKPERDRISGTNAGKVNVTIVIKKSNTLYKSPKNKLEKNCTKLNSLERQVLAQDMVNQRAEQSPINDPNSSSSSEHERDPSPSTSTQAGCRCVEYSHIPQLSAFHKYSQPKDAATTSKGTAMDKKHHSEQYRREFSTYDGITARGRRQAASMPYRRERPKLAAERMQKIRHKLTPVRDYRLMDTVHYLAQGEFAPRDDGIKLTPSREAVLSDIIWEDVCRTHWPNARIGRRTLDRTTTRYELQRLIDSLLRDRVAHVERRRRRHYRIIKLSNRHENCRNVGKTGDIIVASHKHRNASKCPEDSAVELKPKAAPRRDHKSAGSTMIPESRRREPRAERGHRSCERLSSPRPRRGDDASPGPSFIIARTEHRADFPSPVRPEHESTTCCAIKNNAKTARLVVRKDSRRRYASKEDMDLEHYILLPTLVIKTPSNIRRQRKFNELYHRILEKRDPSCRVASEAVDKQSFTSIETRDVGVNVNIIKSRSCSPNKQKKSD